MDKAERALEDIAEELAGRGVELGKLFGMRTLTTKGKAFAGPRNGAFVFKLPPDGVAEALALKGAELFDPAMGRPMKEWVVVPAAHAKRWPELAEIARAYVAEIATKTPAKRKQR
jgi:hypothetical protein